MSHWQRGKERSSGLFHIPLASRLYFLLFPLGSFVLDFQPWTGDVWSCDSCIPIPFPRLSEHLSSKDSPLTRRHGVSESNFPWIGRIRFHQPHADRAAERNEHQEQGKSLVSPAGRICVHPALALSPIPQAHNACMGLLLARCPCLLHLPSCALPLSGQDSA